MVDTEPEGTGPLSCGCIGLGEWLRDWDKEQGWGDEE